MKTNLTILFLAFCCVDSLSAQGVRGSVIDAEDNPLAFATIFVQENGSGTTTNEQGIYELKLAAGNYTLVFQFLGYKTKVEKVSIGDRYKNLDVVLNKQVLELQTIDVFEGREDPAYTIMRKTIAKASFHRQQLDRYAAQVYIKGTGRLKKAPRIFRKMLEKEGVDTSTTFTTESVSKIEYTRPNTFKETVISIYEHGEDNSTSPNAYINSSFYQPEIAEAISPLSPKAFAYYRFKLEGYFYDRNYAINKIKVIPRSPGENVFDGHLYIVDDYWSLYRTDLRTYKFGIEFQIDQVYAPIEDVAWLPVSHQFEVNGKIFGFAFIYEYLATVSNYEIELNPDLDFDFQVIDEKIEQELAAEIEQASSEKNTDVKQRLQSGQEITRKELRKMIRDYEKEERKKQEEPEVILNTTFKVDSNARKRDSIYWENIRPVPLTATEIRGYEKVDSLAKARREEEEESEEGTNGPKSKEGRWQPGYIVTGNRYKIGEKSYFSHASFLEGILFNPVEGFNLHTDLALSFAKKNRFNITMTPRYAFSRKRFSMVGESELYAGSRLKRSLVRLSGGRYIFQYNEEDPIDDYVSSFINLFQEKNFIRLYEKEFLELALSKRFRENLTVRSSLEWARRQTLYNTTSQTWFGKEDRQYASNIPANLEAPDLPFFPSHRALVFTAQIQARPWQKYRIRNKHKIAIEDTSPDLTLTYKKGINNLLDSEVDYDLLDLTFKHKFNIGAKGLVNLKISGGAFLNDESLSFVDFKHFLGNRTSIVTTDPVGNFRLLNYYEFSTRDRYASVHAHYQFRKFLFTRIPEVWLLGIKENLFINYLNTPKSDNYFELGYSVDNILRFFRIEAAVSFRDGKYRDFGILVGVASNLDDIFD